MNEEKRTNDDLDAILRDIMGDRASLPEKEAATQSSAAPVSSAAYVSFEEDDDAIQITEDMGATRVIEKAAGETPVVADEAATRMIDAVDATRVIAVDSEEESESEDDPAKRKKSKNGEAIGCLKAILYIFFVLLISVVLALFIFKTFTDLTGIGRSTTSVNVEVPAGASTQDVAELLREEGVIDVPLVFRLYCRLLGADGSFHPGVHIVSSNMGYDGIVDELSTIEQSETVTVMIEEGATVERIAKILEANDVCSAKDFYTALVTGDYSDYDFVAEITQEQRKDRIYLLEGYLFPDTYEFYVDGSPEAVVRTMLDNFNTRVDADTRASIKASGKTIDEVIIAASIIQMEAGVKEDMPRVMRVIENRLSSPDAFPRLEMDSTRDYLLGGSAEGLDTAYNTYERNGLPVGAICNPGLDAIHAALNPSQEPEIINCFYFASIIETGETAFFETFWEHESWCIEHGVGMYG